MLSKRAFYTLTASCLLFALMFALTACPLRNNLYDSEKLALLNIGMTKAEALSVMKHGPDRVSAKGSTEYFVYKQSNDEYFIRFIDGKVESYGKLGDFDTLKDPTLNLNVKRN